MNDIYTITEALAEAVKGFPFLGEITAGDLRETVRLELGHEEALDRFVPYGKHWTQAFGPKTLLHIVSGNTPHAALQSLIRGLLLKSRNLVKIPSAGLKEVEAFWAKLPEELRARVMIESELRDAWIDEADAVIAFGSDETLAAIRRKVPFEKPFFGHGHRLSFGIIFDDAEMASVAGAARDASLYDQQGCLSPHLYYIKEHEAGDARRYAERLAAEMEAFQKNNPRGEITREEAAQILHLRAGYRFRSANDTAVAILESAGSDAWTVIYESDPWFAPSCLNRVIYVKPLPADLKVSLAPVRQWLGAIGIWPCEERHAESLAGLGASRICAVGRMQEPFFTWHQEGAQSLAPLVRWVDFDKTGGEGKCE